MIHIKIIDKNKERGESPYTISDSYKTKINNCQNTKSLEDIGFNINTKNGQQLFYYLVKENNKILTSENSRFFFSDNFIMFGEYLTSHFIAGFGERYHDFILDDGLYTSWPNDTQGIHFDDGKGGHNLMGLQPIGLHKTKDNKFLGILFNNINAQDTYINTISDDNVLLEHRTIGGVIDYYLYYDEDPDKVLIKIHDIVGQPLMPPFWSFGFHQSRYGYLNIMDFIQVRYDYTDKNLPIDAFWTDIDIYKDYKNLELNTDKFMLILFKTQMKIYKDNNYHYIPLVDLGFKIDTNDTFYNEGHSKNAFLISNYTKQELIAYNLPGQIVFPDFFNPDMQTLWDKILNEFYKNLTYDGLWIDNNEPGQLLELENTRGELLPEGYDYDVDKNQYEYIPYIPGFRENEHTDLRTHSLSENAISIKNKENPLYTCYNFKALIALMEAEYTKKNFRRIR